MKYYRDPNTSEIFAYEADGSQDEHIKQGLIRMTDAEVQAHLNPPLAPPTPEQLASVERSWRNGELARADIELNKVQDGMGVGTVASWREYRCLLRDWPQHTSFPDSSFRPVAPDFL